MGFALAARPNPWLIRFVPQKVRMKFTKCVRGWPRQPHKFFVVVFERLFSSHDFLIKRNEKIFTLHKNAMGQRDERTTMRGGELSKMKSGCRIKRNRTEQSERISRTTEHSINDKWAFYARKRQNSEKKQFRRCKKWVLWFCKTNLPRWSGQLDQAVPLASQSPIADLVTDTFGKRSLASSDQSAKQNFHHCDPAA